MLTTLRDILQLADQNNMAVGAFNVADLNCARAELDAAEEAGMPIILQFAPVHETFIPLGLIGPILLHMAEQASVPVCVHLDHGEKPEQLQQALELGFTSVMFDGSTLPYAENVRQTRQAVELAASYGASVEAEIGSMGAREDGKDNIDADKIYTDPAEAEQFVRETGIDALACSFGTTHGLYKSAPALDFTIVEEVRKRTGGLPIVMHGGSGVREEDYQKAIVAGVRKINYFTYMDKAGGSAAAAELTSLAEDAPVFFSELAYAARLAMQENVAHALRIFSCAQA